MLAGVPLPDRKKTGFVVDHACKNILCVNPRHLRIVPHAANVKELADRSQAAARVRLAKAIGRSELRRSTTNPRGTTRGSQGKGLKVFTNLQRQENTWK